MNEEVELLKELKFNIGTRGFMYWIYAIEEYKINKTDIKEIYKMLAEKEQTTWQNIERSMKYTRRFSERVIKNYYNYSGKLTNKVILNLMSM